MFFNTWQFNLFFYVVLVVGFNQLYKFAVRTLKNDGAGTVIMQILAGLLALLLAPFFPLQFPTDWKIYLFLTIACVFYAVNDRLQTTIRKNMEVSTYTVLNRLSSVFLMMIGVSVFHESVSLLKIVGSVFILGSSFLLSYQAGKFKLDRYLILAIISNVAMAIALSIDIDISTHFNLPIYIMLTLIIPALIISVFDHISLASIKLEIKNGSKGFFFLTSFSWALFIFFMIRSYQFSTFTLITPLASTTVLISVIIATVFFGEKQNLSKKIIAALLTMVGAYLTVIG